MADFERFPMWARKPQSRDNVIATNQGWVNEKTGEVLVSVRDLPSRLAEYFGVADVVTIQAAASVPAVDVGVDEPPKEVVKDVVVLETPKVEEKVEEPKVEKAPVVEEKKEVEAPAKRKPGRPKKARD